ncbi:MAG: amino acid ABC transporter permease [Arenicella sp.]
MLESITTFFRELAITYPKWNFIFFYEEKLWDKVVSGIWVTIELSVVCTILSVVVGIFGAWAQTSRSLILRMITQAYIQFFRNTPPLIQLLFFFFALGQFTPSVLGEDGWSQYPIITAVGWAIISLSLFAGAYNVEIFRAGIEAVPDSTKEAAEALGFNSIQTYLYIVFPLALRVSLPALNNNLVNLVKTTNQAIVIAVPELFYVMVSIYNDYASAQNAAMSFLFVFYLLLVGVLVYAMNCWERKLQIPGVGNH